MKIPRRMSQVLKPQLTSACLLLLAAFIVPVIPQDPYPKPILLWTQKSWIWSKMRGVSGPPQDWVGTDRRPYIQTPASKTEDRYAIGYDPVRDFLYWSEKNQHTISRQNMEDAIRGEEAGVQVMYENKDSEVQAMAVDWLTGNVYFTEGSHGWVAVISANQGQRNISKILFSSQVENPKGIAVDPTEGLIFWSDKGKSRLPKIERATTDGKDREILIDSGMSNPRGVTLDRRERRVYWVDPDDGVIMSINYDGKDKTRVIEGLQNKHLFDLSLYQDYIFVTTSQLLKLNVYDKTEKRVVSEIDVDAVLYYSVMAEDLPEAETDHECAGGKSCGHLCLNTGQKEGMCDCSQGYYLQLDGTSCSTSKPKMIYSIGKAVLSADVVIEDSSPHVLEVTENVIAKDMHEVQAVGFHYEEDQVYYSDTVREVIYRTTSEGRSTRELTVQTQSVQGLSVDWTSNQVYWTDEGLGHIMTSKLDGRYHSIHITGLNKPRGLAVDPVNSYLFIVGGDGDQGYIKRVGIGIGSEEEVLLTRYDADFQSIVADPRTSKIFFTDLRSNIIEYMDIDGAVARTVSEAPDYGLYGVTLFQDYMSWTEGKKELQFGLRRTGNKMENKMVNPISIPHERSYGVVAFDVYLQPETQNGCMRNNGGCDQLCFPAPGNSNTCGCAIGFTLNKNGKACDTEMISGQFAYFVDPYHKQVYTTTHDPDKQAVRGVPLHSMEFPTSVDYDSPSQSYYWIDRDMRSIRRQNIDGNDEKVLLRITENSMPELLYLDPNPNKRHVYYTDSVQKAIIRINMDGSGKKEIVGNIPSARAFVVDYIGGMLYWANGNIIEGSRLDGTDRETVVENVRNISNLAYYEPDQMLYYSDISTGEIGVKNVSSGESDTLVSVPQRQIYSIAVSKDYIYYVAWNKKGVYRVDRETGDNEVMIGAPVFARITDIRAMDDALPAVATGVNMVIYIAAAAGALLLFLILLAAILLGRRACAKRKLAQPDEPHYETPDGNGFDPPTDSSFDPPVAGVTNGLGNGHINGHVTNGHLPPRDYTPDVIPVSSNGHVVGNGHTSLPNGNGHTNNGYVDHRHDVTTSPRANGHALPPPPVLAAPPPAVKRKNLLRKKAAAPPPDDSTFELAGGAGAKATMIQRLANRLRKGISSIRWSGHHGEGGEEGAHGGGGHHGGGRSAKDMANRKKRNSQHDPRAMTSDGDPSGEPYDYDYKPQKKTPRKPIDIPPNTHKMPRGFAPASHCVPITVKQT